MEGKEMDEKWFFDDDEEKGFVVVDENGFYIAKYITSKAIARHIVRIHNEFIKNWGAKNEIQT